MRRDILLAAALALSCCGPRAPKGSEAFSLDAGDRDFRFDARQRRVLFVRGTYPEKTYVGSVDLAASRLSVHRSAGRMIIGQPAGRASSPRALFRAASIVDQYAGENAEGDLVLETSPGDASADRVLQLDERRQAVCIAETEWSGGILVAAGREGRETLLGRWRTPGGEFETFASLPPGISDCSASPRSPLLGLILAGKTGARFAVWNVGSNRETSSIPLPPEPRIVGRDADGRLFITRDSGKSDDHFLVVLNPETGRSADLFTSTASIVSAIAMPSGAAALLRDDRAASGIAGHLKPQSIVKIGKDGRVEWTKRWTRLPSRLVGFDAKTGRLLVAVMDPAYAGLWAVPTDEAGFTAAVERLERETSPVRRRFGTAIKVIIFGAFFLTLVTGLLNARG